MQYQKPVVARTQKEANPHNLKETLEESITELVGQYRDKLWSHYATEHREYSHTPMKVEIMVRISLPIKRR